MLTATTVRRRIAITGIVQGVGFRPFVARLALGLKLGGWCRNSATQVVVEVEGPAFAVDAFAARLLTEAPPLAVIVDLVTDDLLPTGERGFAIVTSQADEGARTLVPPDAATCDECLAEMRDPQNRRYEHPFITCTNCGPRLTIITDLPYDRPATTMAGFAMCGPCAAEYSDPTDRRHHAQPISCHDCGPSLALRAPAGTVLERDGAQALEGARAALREGRIVAIKGIGGYHLACDAANDDAVSELRRRKGRPDQPFAVLVRDLGGAARIATVTDTAAAILTSTAAPIALLDASPAASDHVAPSVAPGLPRLGVMLPYTPAHHLLMDGGPPVLVLTSGNRSGEPLCTDDDVALTSLAGIADLFLTHDRPIHLPCEDSVVALDGTRVLPIRRSRGFAPVPVSVPAGDTVVLAVGAELKNTSALARDGLVFVSAHVGDLGTMESQQAHDRSVEQLVRFHGQAPGLVVADAHPGYASRALAQRYAQEHGVPLLEVQHHHAHLAALAAEHGRTESPLLGLVFDGTGYGCDETIWGGELLELVDEGRAALRHGHLSSFPLPGGDSAVRNPVRIAAAALLAQGRDLDDAPLVAAELTADERSALPGLVTRAQESGSMTSSAGRLFDVVSSLLGVRHRVSYEGQAAIELEVAATRWAASLGGSPGGPAERVPNLDLPDSPSQQDGAHVLDVEALVGSVLTAQSEGHATGAIAWAFHDVLASASVEAAAAVARERGLDTVGLTGGVFQNRLLLDRTLEHLALVGLRSLVHQIVPPNDGGIALGQVAVGLAHGRSQ